MMLTTQDASWEGNMPTAKINGITMAYEVLGDRGPWVALSPGGRREGAAAKGLGRRMAAAGHRVVIFDRRNCGASDISIERTDKSESEIWAEDLHELLSKLGAFPVAAGGGSSGCRLAVLLALRYPKDVSALLLWRVTGGEHACKALAHQYYGAFVEAAQQGGMKAVCETEHFAGCIAANPSNRDYLMGLKVEEFIRHMRAWAEYFLRDKDLPIIGASEQELRSLRQPACIVPGNDWRHNPKVAARAAELIPISELHDLIKVQRDVDLGPHEDWDDIEEEMATTFVKFLKQHATVAAK
jgi:pimeloyl-ACP methyl ester carboxylesterase